MTAPVSRLRMLMTLATAAFPERSLGAMKKRGQIIAAGLSEGERIDQLRNADGALKTILSERPEIFGALIWPYQHAGWDRTMRMDRIISHYQELDRAPDPLPFSARDSVVLMDLSHMAPGLRMILDQPIWFQREGGLTVNLFLDEFRAFSVAFSLYRPEGGPLQAVIGSVQGRNRDDLLDVYRDLTKALHGIRPRDFTIEIVRMLCQLIGVEALYGVADSARHHRHPYFTGKPLTTTANYDEIWSDRGGQLQEGDIYALPLRQERRPLEEIKAKKRSMYRKRYEFLDQTEAQLIQDWPTLTPIYIEDD